MKRVFFVFLAVFFSAGLSLQAQDWSLPQDNKPIKTITWATPAELTLKFDYPFKGVLEWYTHLGSQKQMRKDRTGTYTLRVPNKFKGNGLIGTGYAHKAREVTWAIGDPDPSAGYTETRVSWKSDWQQSAPDPVASWRTDHDVGTVIFLNDVIINGSVAFAKGPARSFSGLEIGHSCYSSLSDDGISSNCPGLEQFVHNSDTELYYQFVKAADNSNAIILWGIFSTSSRYANQPKKMEAGGGSPSKANSSPKKNWTEHTNGFPFSYHEGTRVYTVLVSKRFKNTEGLLPVEFNPDASSGYTTTTFTAHCEEADWMSLGYYLSIDSELVVDGKVIFEKSAICEPHKKSDYGILSGTSLPSYISFIVGSDYKNYYFLQSSDDPYTLIFWGKDK
jgi:hypothetical protein